ncbi:MAG TPA: zinc ribbon domain-containing protein [Anaerolineales bacterium]|nr:zinc ribbon domain-containing protein [Anaerolineales bacterium]
MPIFEFVCPNCGSVFEELVRSAGQASEVVCPDCGSEKVKKKISTIAARSIGGSAGSFNLSSAACSPGGA